jgi:hypothetical protein
MGERLQQIRHLESMEEKLRIALVKKMVLPSAFNRRQRVVDCILWVLFDSPGL